MTAMESGDCGDGVVLAEDVTGRCSDAMQDACVTMIRRLWGRVATTEEIIAEPESHPGATRRDGLATP